MTEEENNSLKNSQENDFKIGDLTWAKIKVYFTYFELLNFPSQGYPWWPGMIVSEDSLSSEVLKSKPKKDSICVHFFGSRDYGWFSQDEVKPLASHWDDFSNKNKTHQFLRALKEAKTPECLFEPPAPPEIKKRKSTNNEDGSKKKARKSVAQDETEDDEALESEHSSKKSKKKKPGNDSATKDRRRRSFVKKSDNEEEKESTEFYLSLEDTDALDRVMKMRIKLQKFLQLKEERDERSFEKAHECLLQVEMLPTTKLGKVLKKIPGIDFSEEADKYHIKARVNTILAKWKNCLEDSATAPAANDIDMAGNDARKSDIPDFVMKDESALSPKKENASSGNNIVEVSNKARSASPQKEMTSPTQKQRSISPAKEKVGSPKKDRSASPNKLKESSPMKQQGPAAEGDIDKSVENNKSPLRDVSPAKEVASKLKDRSTSPVKEKASSPTNDKIISPTREKPLSPIKLRGDSPLKSSKEIEK
ncbi:hypothetical protein HK099_001418 [Clydaea vesicula]|uniref:PWWP domain-containing protein n=1 Tax=Clydaea vesicula TaxID=447962 RepID=A0AAD5U7I9_9FUNG|nr:hypothetical protein HK099_001418 [Clydaea vesicula]